MKLIHSMPKNQLPRDFEKRLLLGAASLTCGSFVILGTIAVFVCPLPMPNALAKFILDATIELLVVGSVLTILAFIWAVAVPAWIERLFHSVLEHCYLAIVIATLPIVILTIHAVLKHKPW